MLVRKCHKVIKRQLSIQQKGFSLIELLVVIVLLGILLVVGISRYYSAIDESMEKVRLGNLKTIQKLIEIAYPKPEESEWENFIINDLQSEPTCPYSGQPFEMLTGTLDPTNPDNICKVAYQRMDDERFVLTSYKFVVGWTSSTAVKITHIEYRGMCNNEYVIITNYSNNTVNIGNWTLNDESIHVFTFGNNTTIPAFSFITVPSLPKVQSGVGEWNRRCGRGIWNDRGDTATLKDNLGNTIDTYSY